MEAASLLECRHERNQDCDGEASDFEVQVAPAENEQEQNEEEADFAVGDEIGQPRGNVVEEVLADNVQTVLDQGGGLSEPGFGRRRNGFSCAASLSGRACGRRDGRRRCPHTCSQA